MSGTKRPEEREFYLRVAAKNGWNVREVARQIEASLFERALLEPPQLSTALREMQPEAVAVFKDAYTLEFLELSQGHSGAELHRGLLRNLGRFITELGRDFCVVGSEYPVQVGNQDFAVDLVFFHRALTCLVAIELKNREFRPEDLGKLSFYLEALDRDVKRPHERPSIGLLLCATKDAEVVEYALSRTLSPALVAEYQTALPPKAVLQAKLHELYAQLAPTGEQRPTRTARKPAMSVRHSPDRRLPVPAGPPAPVDRSRSVGSAARRCRSRASILSSTLLVAPGATLGGQPDVTSPSTPSAALGVPRPTRRRDSTYPCGRRAR